jgi:alpha-galactosidase
LPVGATRFKAKAALDNGAMVGGTQGRSPNNAKFLVFVEDPAGPVPPVAAEISVKFEQLGITGTHKVKDLWTGEDLGKFTDEFKQTINRHGAGLYRIIAN